MTTTDRRKHIASTDITPRVELVPVIEWTMWSTFEMSCPSCKAPIVADGGLQFNMMNMARGRCPACQTQWEVQRQVQTFYRARVLP